MHEKQLLLIPGPTMVPPRVLRAMGAPVMGHRSKQFSEIITEVAEDLKKVFQTEQDVYILTSSGSGAMEAAVVNFINPGDKVIVVVNGKFGDRFAKINEGLGAEVIRLDYEAGKAANPADVSDLLAKNSDVKAVFVQHNETSTAVVNDIKAIKKAMGDNEALLIVDSISGMAVADLPVDEIGADVVVAGSQKAFMVPPGLAFITVSEKAWKVNEKCTSFSFYFNLRAAKKSYGNNTTPFTPATHLILGLRESLKIILEQGLEAKFKEQLKFRKMIRTAVKALGLGVLVEDEKSASPGVTAVRVPDNIAWSDINNSLINEFNSLVAGGQDELKGKIFRIGHMGYVQDTDLITVIANLEMALYKLGYKFELGTGVKAAQEVILNAKGDM